MVEPAASSTQAVRTSPPLTPVTGVRLLPDLARFSLRGNADALSAAGAALGLSLSQTACRSATAGPKSALWLGPDEQLLLIAPVDAAAVSAALAAALEALAHSVVDISHRQIALEVAGPVAQTMLNAGCPLDLDPAAFPVGMCTRTVLAKADIVLWRTGPDTFHVEVWRSFAAYVSRFLAEAARELV